MKKTLKLFTLSIVLIWMVGCNKDEGPVNSVNIDRTEVSDDVLLKSIPGSVTTGVFFDDFSYTSSADENLLNFGWVPREGGGGPGPGGVAWLKENITFLPGPGEDNTVMQLASQTSGGGKNTFQSEINTAIKFAEATFAARIWFTDEPASGPDLEGDEIIETFFTIADWELARQDEYAEFDFEYLANGGWGVQGPTLWNTSWETASNRVSDNEQGSIIGSWHTCVIQCTETETKYYMDGVLKAHHYPPYVVDGIMSINFNLWYTTLDKTKTLREWVHQIDWVYAKPNSVVDPAQIESEVAAYKAQGVDRLDTTE
jgi:hypothetical protein